MDTIISIIKQNMKDYSDKPVLKYKDMGKFKDITWGELKETVRLVTCALLDLGVRIGDRIAILSENRPGWVYADLATLSCNAITVPIYTSNTAKDIEYILKDSGAEIIFVSTYDSLQKVLSIAGNTALRRIISFKERPSPDPLVTEFKDLLASGKEKLQAYSNAIEQRAGTTGPDDVVTIIYTSGSTGPAKGAMLTNRNFVSNCRASTEAININQRDRYLSFLPLSHVFERMGGYYALLFNAAEIAYAESRDTILDDAKRVSPTIMYGVPRFFEKVYARILNNAVGESPLKKNLFFWGYRVGRACMLRRIRKKRIPIYLAAQRLVVTKRISKRIKKSLGGRLRFFISGGAPLSKEIAYFFLSFDILILEGYGLTESSPVITVNRPDDYKIGTVGLPVSGVEVKIAPDGEILAKGDNIMKGYYRQYKDTEGAVKDGWLYTGDIGHIDKDGFLVVTERKKDIIVTSGGKNISPSEVETHIKADRYIEDMLIYGDKKKYLAALIIPDFENLTRYAGFKKIPFNDMKELVENDTVRDFIRRRIEKMQEDLPPFSRVKKFIILNKKLTQDQGELTPTLKIKRREVTAKYKDLLDGLYESDIE